MAGLSFLINTLLGVMIGNAGGGLIDFMIFGVLRGTETKWYLNLIIGIVYAIVYYNVFKYVIVKFNVKTPGREVEDEDEVEEYQDTELGDAVMEALGGRDNIKEIDNCISRLRVVLENTKLADDKKLKATGSLGIIKIDDHNIQVVYGTKVEKVAYELKKSYKNRKEVKKEVFVSPMTGKLIKIEDVEDKVFAEKTMGEGFAIEMTDGVVVSPVSGEVISAFPTGHAFVIETNDNVDILIHIGMDTVKLNGEGFKTFVKKGDIVKQGDKLVEVDIDYVTKQEKSLVSPIVFISGENVKLLNDNINVKAGKKNIIEY